MLHRYKIVGASPLLRAVLTAAVIAGFPAVSVAAEQEQSLWTAWFNSTKFNDRFGLVSDVQLRSRDDVEGLGTLLIRPGLAWYAAPGITPSIGYAYIGSYRTGGPDSDENRIWQQIVTKHSFGSSVVNQRFRLEQRFIDRPDGVNVYSDRFRWFVRGKIPLAAARGSTYLALQNEVFLGISGEDELNGESFDQNRAYIGIGRRLNATYQVEIGYMNQFVNGRGGETMNHAFQFSLFSDS